MITKTDIYGLFKPQQGDNDWGHYLALNADMVDRLMAAQADAIVRLQRRIESLSNIVADLHKTVDSLLPPEKEL